MVDALVSGASVERRASSILVVGTSKFCYLFDTLRNQNAQLVE